MNTCSLMIGLALHNPAWDKPEVDLDRVMGTVTVECVLPGDFVGEFKHISGLTTTEKGYGMNYIEISKTIWRW